MMFPGIVPHHGTFVPRNVPDSPCTVSDLVTYAEIVSLW